MTDSELWGRLARRDADPHVLCLNAGIVGPTLGVPWDVPAAEWDRVLAVNLGGDADTNGAVTGALAGARFGAGAPERIRERLAAWRESGVTTLLVQTHDRATLRAMAELVL